MILNYLQVWQDNKIKGVFHNEIGLCAQNADTTLSSIVQHKWEGLGHHLKSKRNFHFEFLIQLFLLDSESDFGTRTNTPHDNFYQMLVGWNNFQTNPTFKIVCLWSWKCHNRVTFLIHCRGNLVPWRVIPSRNGNKTKVSRLHQISNAPSKFLLLLLFYKRE